MVKKSPIKSGNLTVDFYDIGGTQTWLYFPGFPGPAAIQPEGRRPTIDLFVEKACRHKANVAFVYYQGISPNNGSFSFLQSIKDGPDIVTYFRNLEHKVHLVGHSWGAVVALNAISNSKLNTFDGKVFLLTPFLFLPNEEQASILYREFLTNYPELFQEQSLDSLLEEHKEIIRKYQPLESMHNLSAENSFMYIAKYDEVVPANLLEAIAKKYSIPSIIKNQPHAFATDEEFEEVVEKYVLA